MDVNDWIPMVAIFTIIMLGGMAIIGAYNDPVSYNGNISTTQFSQSYNQTAQLTATTTGIYQSTFGNNATGLSSITSLLTAGWGISLQMPSMATAVISIGTDVTAFFGLPVYVIAIFATIIINIFVFTIAFMLFRIGVGRISQ